VAVDASGLNIADGRRLDLAERFEQWRHFGEHLCVKTECHISDINVDIDAHWRTSTRS